VIKIVRLDTIMHAMWDAIISAARFQEDSERWRERERERERRFSKSGDGLTRELTLGIDWLPARCCFSL
jgi:hypothetical protein